MKHYIEDKSIIITGGSSGFGLEAARLLLEMGAKVAITGRDAKRLKAAGKSLAGGKRLLAVQADATSTTDWLRLMKKVVDRFGGLDVLINNHGAGVKIAAVQDMDDDAIRQVLDINITSVIIGCREAVRVMRPSGRGLIVNVSSGCAYHAWANWAVYTAAKDGMVGFTRCLHREMAEWGGRASCFIPGAAKTNFCAAAKIDDSWQGGYPDAVDFARTLVHCVDVPDNCVIEEVNIWGTKQIKDMLNPY